MINTNRTSFDLLRLCLTMTWIIILLSFSDLSNEVLLRTQSIMIDGMVKRILIDKVPAPNWKKNDIQIRLYFLNHHAVLIHVLTKCLSLWLSCVMLLVSSNEWDSIYSTHLHKGHVFFACLELRKRKRRYGKFVIRLWLQKTTWNLISEINYITELT